MWHDWNTRTPTEDSEEKLQNISKLPPLWRTVVVKGSDENDRCKISLSTSVPAAPGDHASAVTGHFLRRHTGIDDVRAERGALLDKIAA